MSSFSFCSLESLRSRHHQVLWCAEDPALASRKAFPWARVGWVDRALFTLHYLNAGHL